MLSQFGVKNRWGRTLNVVLAAFAVIGVVQIVRWSDRSPPITVHYRVIKTSSVAPGDDFMYDVYFTRKQYCDTTVTRWFITSDNQRVDIAPLPSFMPTEALNIRQISEAKIMVPLSIPPGPTKSCFQSEWKCNPIQNIFPIHSEEVCLSFLTKPKPLSQLFTPSARQAMGIIP